MSDSNYLSEFEFKRKVCEWLLKYDISFVFPPWFTLDDMAQVYRLPEIDYVHLDSFIDENDDVLTYLKGEISLKASQSKSCKKQKIVFYHILRTFIDSPEVEPYPVGYYIAAYVQGY